jgi:hypothetical protein
LQAPYKVITSKQGRRAPKGKYRVMLTDYSSEPINLYLVCDCDSLEEAIVKAEPVKGIVQNHKDWVLYPWFDGHQLHTRKELMKSHSQLTSSDIAAIESKQCQRIPGWKEGHRMVVFWNDISEATGARAHPGDF